MTFKILACLSLCAVSCYGQTILFKSGFEARTHLQELASGATGPRGNVQEFSGADASTGYSWPLPVNEPTGINGIHLEPCLTGDTQCGDLLTHHFKNYLDTGTRHSGNASLFLSLSGYPEGMCCPQEPVQSSAFRSPLTEIYLRYWMMIPPGFAAQLSRHGSYWRMLTENKAVGDYRMELMALKGACSAGHCPVQGASTLTTEMMADARGQDPRYDCPYADPITGAALSGCNVYMNEPYQYMHINNLSVIVPIGRWFEVEWYMKRSAAPDGKYFAAIDGHTVGDWSGPNYGMNRDPIQDMYWINLYTNRLPASEWIDDLEIWDAPPCSVLPCGTATRNGGGYSGMVPPSITSYRAAIGAVGVPFSYTIQATNHPTSYSISWNKLPPGLSLNVKTGVISGIPVRTVIQTVAIQANNDAGNGTIPLEFMINNSVQTPIIHDLWATPFATALRGGASTLTWNVLGAGAVALSIEPGIGPVSGMSGSIMVHPTVTTSYQLTARNRAGSVTKSIVVHVPDGVAGKSPAGVAP